MIDSTSKPSRLDEAVRAWTPGSYDIIGGYNPRPRILVVGAAGPGLQRLRDRIEAARLREAQR